MFLKFVHMLWQSSGTSSRSRLIHPLSHRYQLLSSSSRTSYPSWSNIYLSSSEDVGQDGRCHREDEGEYVGNRMLFQDVVAALSRRGGSRVCESRGRFVQIWVLCHTLDTSSYIQEPFWKPCVTTFCHYVIHLSHLCTRTTLHRQMSW